VNEPQTENVNEVVPAVAPAVAAENMIEVPDYTKTNKTKKHYNDVIINARNIKKRFTSKRKNISTWNENDKHKWRNELSDSLIGIVKQYKNKNTYKHHHIQLRSLRNSMNHYLNYVEGSRKHNKDNNKTKKKTATKKMQKSKM
jgi:hypothetical protein